MNKFCANCGTPFVEGNKFCINCGSVIDTPAEAPVVEETPAVEEASEVTEETAPVVETVEEVKPEEAVEEAAPVEAAEVSEATETTEEKVEEKAPEASAEDVVIVPIIEHYQKTAPEVLAEPIETAAPQAPVVTPEAPVVTPAATPAPVYQAPTYQYTNPTDVPPVSSMGATAAASDGKDNSVLFGVLSLVMFFSMVILAPLTEMLPIPFIQEMFATLTFLLPVAGIVLMIVGRVKYPKSVFLKVVMWIIIVCSILAVVSIIIFVLLCMATCAMCRGMG